MSALVLLAAGTGSDGVRMLIRATARSSALLFLVAYLARPLRQLWRTDATGFVVKNRRYFGVSMAVSHLIHGIAIVWLFGTFRGAYETDAITVAGGGLGFLFIAAMAATSSDAAFQKLGRARWQLLHRSGIWYLWFVFAFTFLPKGPEARWDALHAGFVAAFAAAPLFRVAAWLKARRRKQAAPAPA
jgi:DMSO/TMAO reductase YedYZ heme-binding membrane subunit